MKKGHEDGLPDLAMGKMRKKENVGYPFFKISNHKNGEVKR